jgi:hypothetical protein
MYMGESMAKGHLISPHIAMWLSNLVLGAAGMLLLFWRAWSAERRIAIPLPFLRHRSSVTGPSDAVTSAAPGPILAAGTEPARFSARGDRVVVVIRLPYLSLPGWTLLDGYVLRLYLKICALAFFGMLGIFYIATFIDLSDKLFKGQTTGWMLLRYFWFATVWAAPRPEKWRRRWPWTRLPPRSARPSPCPAIHSGDDCAGRSKTRTIESSRSHETTRVNAVWAPPAPPRRWSMAPWYWAKLGTRAATSCGRGAWCK